MAKIKTKIRETEIIDRLKSNYPDAHCALNFKNPLQLLIATILSAQCTDVRVNIVTKDLFQKYKTAKDFANANINELEEMVRSTGFYHNKAKNIKAAAEMIVEKYKGVVPDEMDQLIELPGAARKTANVVLWNAFGKNVGVVVDTHVNRLSNRLRLTKEHDPKKIEQDLMKIVDKDDWGKFSHLLIEHGRKTLQSSKAIM